MPTNFIQPSQSQNCLDVLTHMLDLAMQTADAASAEKNHKLVLQAVREVTRLVTLINKISSSSDKKMVANSGPGLGAPPKAQSNLCSGNREKSGKAATKTGALELFFEKNKLHNRPGKDLGKTAAANAGLNPAPGQAAAAGPILWQDEPVVLAAAESEAA